MALRDDGLGQDSVRVTCPVGHHEHSRISCLKLRGQRLRPRCAVHAHRARRRSRSVASTVVDNLLLLLLLLGDRCLNSGNLGRTGDRLRVVLLPGLGRRLAQVRGRHRIWRRNALHVRRSLALLRLDPGDVLARRVQHSAHRSNWHLLSCRRLRHHHVAHRTRRKPQQVGLVLHHGGHVCRRKLIGGCLRLELDVVGRLRR